MEQVVVIDGQEYDYTFVAHAVRAYKKELDRCREKSQKSRQKRKAQGAVTPEPVPELPSPVPEPADPVPEPTVIVPERNGVQVRGLLTNASRVATYKREAVEMLRQALEQDLNAKQRS